MVTTNRTLMVARWARRIGDAIPGRYRHLLATTLVGTYILMLLGAYTSAIGAGLACPDWPTCYGTWIPFLYPNVLAEAPYTAVQIAAEWVHRTVAVLVGIGILGSAFFAWIKQDRNRVVTLSMTIAFLLLPLQVFIGRLTVTRALEPIIVTSHLGLAILILVLLTAATVVCWWGSG
jgi:cytochrome c oxidase assembly protein subunit 15